MTFVDHFNQITDILLEKLRTKANDKTPVTLLTELNRVTLDAIAAVIYDFRPILIHLVPNFFKDFLLFGKN